MPYLECAKPKSEYCNRHPIDCPNCENGDRCQMRETMWKHRDKLKNCRFFRPLKTLRRK